jgi:hypothetical protein
VGDRIGGALEGDARVRGGEREQDRCGAIPRPPDEPVERNSDRPDDEIRQQQPVGQRIDEVVAGRKERAASEAGEYADDGDDLSRQSAFEDRLAESGGYRFQLPGIGRQA